MRIHRRLQSGAHAADASPACPTSLVSLVPLVPLVSLLLFVVGCASTPARDPDIVYMGGSRGATSAANSAARATMRYDELLGCANQLETMDRDDAALDRQSATIDGTKISVNSLNDSIDRVRPFLDTKSGPAVDAFNARIVAYHAAVTTLNRTIDRYNLAIQDRKQRSRDFDAACANRAYRHSDYNALPANARAIIDRHSKTIE